MNLSGADLRQRASWAALGLDDDAQLSGANLEQLMESLVPVLYSSLDNSIVGNAAVEALTGLINVILETTNTGLDPALLDSLVGGTAFYGNGAVPDRTPGVAFFMWNGITDPIAKAEPGDIWIAP